MQDGCSSIYHFADGATLAAWDLFPTTIPFAVVVIRSRRNKTAIWKHRRGNGANETQLFHSVSDVYWIELLLADTAVAAIDLAHKLHRNSIG